MTWVGGWVFVFMLTVIALAAQREVFDLFATAEGRPGNLAAFLAGMAMLVGPAWSPAWWLVGPLAIASLWWFLIKTPGEKTLSSLAGSLVGIVYPCAFLAGLVAIRLAGPVVSWDPFTTTIGIMILMWTADTAAYYAGKNFGRHSLAPTISPKKTWEGVFGGIAGCLVISVIIGTWFGGGLPAWHWLALGGIVGVVGPIGDLFESAIKRAAAVKDSGSMLPGHGGVLDRFDGLVFVAPVAASYLFLLG